MTQITSGDVLLAGLALPGIADTANRDTADDDRPLQPKRFEEIVGFEVAEVAASHPLAILPLGSLEFHGLHNPLGGRFHYHFRNCGLRSGTDAWTSVSRN